MKKVTYGIVGDGKVSRHIQCYLDLSQISYVTWSRKRDVVAATEKLQNCQVIMVLISDDSIESFLNENNFSYARAIVHFSGSLVLNKAIGMHPLMTFTDTLYDLDCYRQIPFVCEQGAFLFSDIFPMLSNPSYVLPKEKRALYHALCVLSGNFTTILWNKVLRDFEECLGLPESVLYPYLKRTMENLLSGRDEILTGPLERHDMLTITKNIEALKKDPFVDVYKSMCQAVNPREEVRQ